MTSCRAPSTVQRAARAVEPCVSCAAARVSDRRPRAQPHNIAKSASDGGAAGKVPSNPPEKQRVYWQKWYANRQWKRAKRCQLCYRRGRWDGSVGVYLVKDHDHATGMFRGIICHRCNVSLGWLEGLEGVGIDAALAYIDGAL